MEPLGTKTDRSEVQLRVTELSRELRAAVVGGDHSGAQTLASAYVEAVRSLWESWPEEKRSRCPSLAEARELLPWALEATLIQRGLYGDQFTALQMASGYRQSRATPSLQVKA